MSSPFPPTSFFAGASGSDSDPDEEPWEPDRALSLAFGAGEGGLGAAFLERLGLLDRDLDTELELDAELEDADLDRLFVGGGDLLLRDTFLFFGDGLLRLGDGERLLIGRSGVRERLLLGGDLLGGERFLLGGERDLDLLLGGGERDLDLLLTGDLDLRLTGDLDLDLLLGGERDLDFRLGGVRDLDRRLGGVLDLRLGGERLLGVRDLRLLGDRDLRLGGDLDRRLGDRLLERRFPLDRDLDRLLRLPPLRERDLLRELEDDDPLRCFLLPDLLPALLSASASVSLLLLVFSSLCFSSPPSAAFVEAPSLSTLLASLSPDVGELERLRGEDLILSLSPSSPSPSFLASPPSPPSFCESSPPAPELFSL